MEMEHRLTCGAAVIRKYVEARRVERFGDGMGDHLDGQGQIGKFSVGVTGAVQRDLYCCASSG